MHALYAPSSLGVLIRCAGSRYLQSVFPEDTDSEEARIGTAAHWVWDQLLNGKSAHVDSLAPNGVVVDDEMMESAMEFVAMVPKHCELFIEQPVACHRVHPHCWGTPDVWCIPEPRVIEVDDYKHGRLFVDAFENWQCIAYACGIADLLRIAAHERRRWTVRIRICQPRCYSGGGEIMRTWEVNLDDMDVYVSRLQLACLAAERENAPTVVGTHCCYCTGRRGCSTLHAAAGVIMDMSGQAVPLELPPAALGAELRMMHAAKKLLDARIDGLEEHALQLIRQGKDVAHYQIAHGAGRTRWTRPPEEIIALGAMLGVALEAPRKAITPTQALKQGLDPDMAKAFTERPPGAAKLKQFDNKQTRKVFGNGK